MAEQSIPHARRGINDLTAEYVRSILSYDPLTGLLRWRVERRGRPHSLGQVAGSTGKRDYVGVGINGRVYQGHRLAWLIVTGEWPKDDIDHIDGNGVNNVWANLRAATPGENMRNKGRRKNRSEDSLRGVTYFKRDNTWMCRIGVSGRSVFLGYYDTAEEAHEAYRREAIRLHGEFARFD